MSHASHKHVYCWCYGFVLLSPWCMSLSSFGYCTYTWQLSFSLDMMATVTFFRKVVFDFCVQHAAMKQASSIIWLQSFLFELLTCCSSATAIVLGSVRFLVSQTPKPGYNNLGTILLAVWPQSCPSGWVSTYLHLRRQFCVDVCYYLCDITVQWS